MNGQRAHLVLQSGEVFAGTFLGADGEVEGELAVSTAMTGYAESLSDPSYQGQLLVFTYPLIGNYGVSGRELESGGIQAAGLVMSEGGQGGSHHTKRHDLADWVQDQGIIGIRGVDTRLLMQTLRGRGAVWGRIADHDRPVLGKGLWSSQADRLGKVGISHTKEHGRGPWRIGLLDCGVKGSIIKHLVQEDVTVLQLPHTADLKGLDVHGWLLSNGPGDPRDYPDMVGAVRGLLMEDRPILGICLGHQLLALAAGARVEAMPFGHRGHNQPVLELGSKRAYISSQNHGYAVCAESLPPDWQPWFKNLNDGSNEGIRHRGKPFSSVQFHPEAAGGPQDTAFLIRDFVNRVKGRHP
jgi:carbamoyl-phosphate synthase small subunit